MSARVDHDDPPPTDPPPTNPPTPPPTTGWTLCAAENARCAFTGTRQVRYGAGSSWITRNLTASNGGITCSNGTFGGDLIKYTVKRCELAATSGGGTTPQPPTISGSPATSRQRRALPIDSSPRPAAIRTATALAFSITNRPTWATFNTTNGSLTGTPTVSNVGSFCEHHDQRERRHDDRAPAGILDQRHSAFFEWR